MKLAIIGGGAMGSAMAEGILANNAINPNAITISNPHLDKLKSLAEAGVNLTESNREAIKDASIVVIAVKPWKVMEVIEELKPSLENSVKTLSFIVAGIPGKNLVEWVNSPTINLSIAMPNTAMKCGASMTFIVPLQGDNSDTAALFEKVGRVKEIEERLLPAATALASCGIAYAMRYVRAAEEGGVELGFRAAEARDIVVQTLKGVTELLSIPGAHPETEIDKVTTPGGITIRGLNTMEKEGFSNSVIQGLKASR